MKTALSNQQNKHRVDRKKTLKLLEFLATRAARKEPAIEAMFIDLILLDDKSITTVNEACFGLSKPTDVISCGYDAVPGIMEAPAAEIFVNVERAADEGRSRARATKKWSPGKELSLYIAHACDHLAGERDQTAEERRRMRSRELSWLREAERSGLSLRLLSLGDNT